MNDIQGFLAPTHPLGSAAHQHPLVSAMIWPALRASLTLGRQCYTQVAQVVGSLGSRKAVKDLELWRSCWGVLHAFLLTPKLGMRQASRRLLPPMANWPGVRSWKHKHGTSTAGSF